MADIHYQTAGCEGTYRIDEVSQRLLVHLCLHGGSPPREAVGPIGVSNESEIYARVDESLGPFAAGLVREGDLGQTTLTGERNVVRYHLTEAGEAFVYKHKATLSMPADLGELAKTVAQLRVEVRNALDLEDAVDDLSARLTEVEKRLSG